MPDLNNYYQPFYFFENLEQSSSGWLIIKDKIISFCMNIENQSELLKPCLLSPNFDSFTPLFEENRSHFLPEKDDFGVDQDPQQSPINPNKRPQIPENIIEILSKQHEERSSAQHLAIYKYLIRFKIFKDLSQHISSEAVKQLLKEGKLKLYNQGDLISSCGRKMRSIRILLKGSVGVAFQQENEEKESDLWNTLKELVEKLGTDTKSFKVKGSNNKKQLQESIPKSYIAKRQTFRSECQLDCTKIIEPETLLDFALLANSQPKYSQTLVVAENDTLIFTLSIDQFYESLLLFYNSKQNNVIKMFRKVPIFDSFDNSALKLLVEKLKLIQIKKGQFVYREGDQPSCFYLLTEGEVEITKTIQILAENPNNLYKSRVKVSRQRIGLNIKALPYANFNGVYNYQNQHKLITLAILSPINVFGEEELIENQLRQVNAKVISMMARMYKISLNEIEEFCTRVSGQGEKEKKMTLIDFFALAQQSLTIKKILLRQNQLSEMVHHQNQIKFKDLVSTIETKQLRKNYTREMRRASTGVTPKIVKAVEEDAPPTFNNFNYTDFLGSEEDEMYQSLPSCNLTSQEANVVKLTHTKFYEPEKTQSKHKDKTIRSRLLSKEIFGGTKLGGTENLRTVDSITVHPSKSSQKRMKSSFVPKITLDEPLFTVKYFQTQEQLERRLVIVAKKKRLESIYKNSLQKYKFG